MEAEITIKGRLEAVEAAVAEIRRELENREPDLNGLDPMIGLFRDEPAFDDVIRLGREFRSQVHPEAEKIP